MLFLPVIQPQGAVCLWLKLCQRRRRFAVAVLVGEGQIARTCPRVKLGLGKIDPALQIIAVDPAVFGVGVDGGVFSTVTIPSL